MNSNFAIKKKKQTNKQKTKQNKKLKLISIRVKELFEPIVLRRKGDGFLLFLKAFSWETDLWVTLGDFTVKKNRKMGKRNLYLTENRLSKNEMWCAVDKHNYRVLHMGKMDC